MYGEGGGGADGNSHLKNADKLNFTPVHRQTTWLALALKTELQILIENADKSENCSQRKC